MEQTILILSLECLEHLTHIHRFTAVEKMQEMENIIADSSQIQELNDGELSNYKWRLNLTLGFKNYVGRSMDRHAIRSIAQKWVDDQMRIR
jgi:hypothetical protein